MSDFEELTIDKGKGEHRTNRFRIYFKNHLNGCVNLPTDFLNNFKSYFEPNEATVDFTDRRFRGKQTLKFVGDVPYAPDFHDDWVYVVHQDSRKGFAAQTLKRNFTHIGEKVAQGTSVVIPGGILDRVFRGLTAEAAITVNQHHFLAGRRSWVIAPACDFDGDIPPNAERENIFALETAAIERFSLQAYQLGAPIFDPMIDTIWTNLLKNYVKKKGFEVVSHRAWPKGKFENNVSYFHSNYESRACCEDGTLGMCKIHTKLWP